MLRMTLTWLTVPHQSIQQKHTIFVFPLPLTETSKFRSYPEKSQMPDFPPPHSDRGWHPEQHLCSVHRQSPCICLEIRWRKSQLKCVKGWAFQHTVFSVVHRLSLKKRVVTFGQAPDLCPLSELLELVVEQIRPPIPTFAVLKVTWSYLQHCHPPVSKIC